MWSQKTDSIMNQKKEIMIDKKGELLWQEIVGF